MRIKINKKTIKIFEIRIAVLFLLFCMFFAFLSFYEVQIPHRYLNYKYIIPFDLGHLLMLSSFFTTLLIIFFRKYFIDFEDIRNDKF